MHNDDKLALAKLFMFYLCVASIFFWIDYTR